eukprot:1535768-Prymnesium_polylepis.3
MDVTVQATSKWVWTVVSGVPRLRVEAVLIRPQAVSADELRAIEKGKAHIYRGGLPLLRAAYMGTRKRL